MAAPARRRPERETSLPLLPNSDHRYQAALHALDDAAELVTDRPDSFEYARLAMDGFVHVLLTEHAAMLAALRLLQRGETDAAMSAAAPLLDALDARLEAEEETYD